MLSTEQIAAYHAQGYTLVEGAVPPALLAEINGIVDDFVAKARGVTANNEVYDLESTHTPEAPRVRRLKEPVERHPRFWDLVRSPGVIAPVTQLIGPDLRLHGSKLNMKGSSISVGHPFAATGARILAVAAKLFDELPQARRGLISVCTAGGMGVTAIVERPGAQPAAATK